MYRITIPTFEQIITLAEQLTPEERARLIQELQQPTADNEDERDTFILNQVLAPYMQANGSIDFDALEKDSVTGKPLHDAMPGFIDEMGELRPEADWHDKY